MNLIFYSPLGKSSDRLEKSATTSPMTTTLPISKVMLSLADVRERLGLQISLEQEFFLEWQQDLPDLTEAETQQVDRLKTRFAAHRDRGTVAEGAVDKLLVSPLLDLVGFYEPEFEIQTEKSVEFTLSDGDEVLRGRMDTLIVRDRFWVLVIEAKRTIMAALAVPQALTYMMCTPYPERPAYGLVSNGEEFLFLKVVAAPTPQYSTSKLFATFFPPHSQELHMVVRVLKRMKAIVIDHPKNSGVRSQEKC
jgi:hypothetical protein